MYKLLKLALRNAQQNLYIKSKNARSVFPDFGGPMTTMHMGTTGFNGGLNLVYKTLSFMKASRLAADWKKYTCWLQTQANDGCDSSLTGGITVSGCSYNCVEMFQCNIGFYIASYF